MLRSTAVTFFFLSSLFISIMLVKNLNYQIDCTMDIIKHSSAVRRHETICYLIGFGIGVGCCILYRLISNFLHSITNSNPLCDEKSSLSSTNIIYSKEIDLMNIKTDHDDCTCNNTNSDEMTWSEMSSSLSTVNLFHDSYHSNSLTGDSGVDCPEIPIRNSQFYDDDEQEISLRKYDPETGFQQHNQIMAESHVMSYISTEKGLERALEQTSRFYTDLEHIASDLGTLTKRYSQTNQSIDALDWDWLDETHVPLAQSPKYHQRKQQQQPIRSNNNKSNKVRRRLNPNINQTDYNESDSENRLFDYSNSPLRRKHSSVYFDSTDNSSDDDNDHLGDETLQINS